LGSLRRFLYEIERRVEMEIDRTIVILGVILLVVLGLFALSQLGSGSGSVSKGVGYAAQYAGGGCGR
jgi:hypothetical protein